jgi:hypothetical protein
MNPGTSFANVHHFQYLFVQPPFPEEPLKDGTMSPWRTPADHHGIRAGRMHLFLQERPTILLAERIMDVAERNARQAKGLVFQVLKFQAPGQGLAAGAEKSSDAFRSAQRTFPRVMISAARNAAADALVTD